MSKSDDYSRSFGGAALGARLRRASERIDRDSTRVYAALNIRFEQRWYGVLRQLIEHDRPMAVGEIAAILHITHASVSEACRSMEKAGLIASTTAPEDARRRPLALTEKGQALAAELAPLWQAFVAAAQEVNEESGDIVRLLDRLDETLDRRSVFDRIMSRISLDEPGDDDR